MRPRAQHHMQLFKVGGCPVRPHVIPAKVGDAPSACGRPKCLRTSNRKKDKDSVDTGTPEAHPGLPPAWPGAHLMVTRD